jgi:hypothetical protein
MGYIMRRRRSGRNNYNSSGSTKQEMHPVEMSWVERELHSIAWWKPS